VSDDGPYPKSDGGVRWGILATGGIAQAFTKDLLLHGHRITAVGSRSISSAKCFAKTNGIHNAHGSYEELAADPDVDAIYIATPHNTHAENATLALDHSKHVLVEKSFTLNAAEARSVAQLGERSGLVVVEAMWTRFLPHMAYIRSKIEAGLIGDIRSLHADHTQSLPRDEAHRINSPGLAGGALLDLGVYPVSFAHDILGAPVELDARATFTSTGVDASVATIMTHDRGAISTSFSSLQTRGPNSATILGVDGRIELADTWYAPTTVSIYDTKNELIEIYDERVSGRGMQYQATEVERLIRDGIRSSPLITPEDSVAVMETLDRIRKEINLYYPGEPGAKEQSGRESSES
jgi:predicted dehydrogenase